MRPRLVDYINNWLNSSYGTYILPTGTTMYVVAMLVVMYVYVKRCEQSGLSAYHALGSCIYGMIGGLAGARIFYLIETLPTTISNPEVLLDVFGGTTSWGVYIGGFAGFFLYLWRNNKPLPVYADVIGSCLGLGPFIGRWSCFLNGCCYGKLSEVPWAVQYPNSSPVFWHQFNLELIPANTSLSLPVHPLPLYLSLSALMVFMVTSVVWRRFRSHPGLIFLSYWILYCSFRFILEFFRGNAPHLDFLELNVGQIMCAVILLVAGISVFRIYTKRTINSP